MAQPLKTCDLCSLDIKVSGFDLQTQDGKKLFCCEGCKTIYKIQMHNAELLSQANRISTDQKNY